MPRRPPLISYQNFSGTVDTSDGPGPGAYNLGSTLHKKHSTTIKAKSKLYLTEERPGPGSYDTFKRGIGSGSDSIAYSIAHSTKKSSLVSTSDQTPGPSDYHQRARIGGRLMASMASRHSSGRDKKTSNDAPAPNSYNTRSYPGRDAPAISIGGRLPRSETTHTSYKTPGPGRYAGSTEDGLAREFGDGKRATPAFSFGDTSASQVKSNAHWIVNDNPGPGAYSLSSTIGGNGKVGSGRGLQKSMGTRTPLVRFKKGQASPGPGAYNETKLNVTNAERSVKFTGRTVYKPPGQTPGAARYFLSRQLGKNAPAFTMRPRHAGGQSTLGMHSPGPSNYDIKPVVGSKSSLQFKLKGRPKGARRTHDETPGPQYNPRLEDKTKAPSFSFSGGGNDGSVCGRGKPVDFLDVTPGPGAYTPFKRLGSDQPAASFHGDVAGRSVQSNSLNVGCGTINGDKGRVFSSFGKGPSITMGGRFYSQKFVSRAEMRRREREQRLIERRAERQRRLEQDDDDDDDDNDDDVDDNR